MIIETDRLILRPIHPERDFEPWARAMADEGTVRYPGIRPLTRAEAERPRQRRRVSGGDPEGEEPSDE